MMRNMNIVISATFFLFGLIIGSFLNVVLVRTEKGESLGGRSRCPHCRALIHWYDNIPLLSFLLLRGKCRACREPIAWQYPLVELGTGVLFALAGALVFEPLDPLSWLTVLWWCFLFAILILIVVYDLRHMEIPLVFLLSGIGGGAVYVVVQTLLQPMIGFWSLPLAQALLGGALASSLFVVLVLVSRERWMGAGDAWLAFLSGLALGPALIFFLLTLAFGLGAMVALTLLALGRKDLSSRVPFAPYLSLATILLLVLQAAPPPWLNLFSLSSFFW